MTPPTATPPRTDKESEEEDYVFVQRQDVVDAVGVFLADYLAHDPQARGMSPSDLQVSHAYLPSIPHMVCHGIVYVYQGNSS